MLDSSSTPLTTSNQPKLVITSPEDFAGASLSAVAPATLADHPLYAFWETVLATRVAQVPAMVSRPPRPYQKRSSIIGALRTNNLFAHEQGTGKSYTVCLLILLLFGSDLSHLKPGAIHIIAPKHTLKRVWLKKELAFAGYVQLGGPEGKDVVGGFADVITNERDARTSKAPIWIYHYDLLKRETEAGRLRKKRGKSGRKLYKLIRKHWAPSLMVVDEIHRCRVGTERTFCMKELRKRAKRVCGLTGTPMDGWVAHLASILGLVYGEEAPAFPYTVNKFTRRFTRQELATRDFVTGADEKRAPRKRPAPGIAVDQLAFFQKATQHLIHRLTFNDPEVIGQVHFPKMDHQIIKLQMDPRHAAYYHDVNEAMLLLINDAIQKYDRGEVSYTRTRHNVFTHLNALRAAADHPWDVGPNVPVPPYPINETEKLRAIRDVCLQAKSEGRKFIVYTNRIAVGRRLTEFLTAAGLKVVRIYDEDQQAKPRRLNQDERDERIEAFQEEDDIDGMVGNLGLLSEGLTIVEASYVLHADHDWMSTPHSQGNNRVVRPGQVYDPIPVLDFVFDGTVNCYVHTAMLRKAKATAQTLDKQFTSESGTIDPLDVARALVSEELTNATDQSRSQE